MKQGLSQIKLIKKIQTGHIKYFIPVGNNAHREYLRLFQLVALQKNTWIGILMNLGI